MSEQRDLHQRVADLESRLDSLLDHDIQGGTSMTRLKERVRRLEGYIKILTDRDRPRRGKFPWSSR